MKPAIGGQEMLVFAPLRVVYLLGLAGTLVLAAQAHDVAPPPQVVRTEVGTLSIGGSHAKQREPQKASLIGTCSPSDERHGGCKTEVVPPDPAIRGPRTTAEEYNARAIGFMEMGRIDRALEDLDAAIRLKPSYAEAFNNRGSVYRTMGKVDRALADYDEAIRLKPGFAPAFFNRAQTYITKRMFREAILDLDAYIATTSDDADAFLARAFAHRRVLEFDSAILDLNKAVQLLPNEPRPLNERCWTKAIAGKDLKAALVDCNASLCLRPQSSEALDSRAFVHFRLRHFDKAIADSTAALTIDPKLATSLYIRGLARARKGDVQGSEVDLAAAKLFDPDVAATYAEYGVIW